MTTLWAHRDRADHPMPANSKSQWATRSYIRFFTNPPIIDQNGNAEIVQNDPYYLTALCVTHLAAHTGFTLGPGETAQVTVTIQKVPPTAEAPQCTQSPSAAP